MINLCKVFRRFHSFKFQKEIFWATLFFYLTNFFLWNRDNEERKWYAMIFIDDAQRVKYSIFCCLFVCLLGSGRMSALDCTLVGIDEGQWCLSSCHVSFSRTKQSLIVYVLPELYACLNHTYYKIWYQICECNTQSNTAYPSKEKFE